MDILETDDGKWDGTLRAFWRRIQGYSKCKFNDIKELPEKMPVEFRAHFATALLASPVKSTIEAMTETAKDASARAILDHNEITALRARVAELESSGWISVDDRLPDSIGETVLIALENRYSGISIDFSTVDISWLRDKENQAWRVKQTHIK